MMDGLCPHLILYLLCRFRAISPSSEGGYEIEV